MQRLFRWTNTNLRAWEQISPADHDDHDTRIVLLSPPMVPGGAVCEVIPSWGAQTPPGSWIEIQLGARIADRWSRWYRLARWDSAATASQRTSFDAQRDADGEVATDTFVLRQPADALRVRVLLCAEAGAALPQLTSLALSLMPIETGERPAPVAPAQHYAQQPLQLPTFSQYAFADGAGWCSPTSLAMVLGYWYQRTHDPRLAPFTAPASVVTFSAPMVYDPAYAGTGNWPFNTAYATTLGLTALVTRLRDLGQLARWIAAGIPVIASIAWREGELENAAIPRSNGHLLVVTGLDGALVHVADPAGAAPSQVMRRYRADQVAHLTQRTSKGAVYLIYPPNWAIPLAEEGDAW